MTELTGKRIFFVDDDINNMVVYNATLAKSGATILQDLWTTDIIHTLMNKLPIDLIVLDLMLRYNIHGYDVFDQIKTYSELRNIPVVIVSAADPVIEIPRSRAKGTQGFIGKPINPRLFPKQLEQCISGKSIWYAPGIMENESEDEEEATA